MYQNLYFLAICSETMAKFVNMSFMLFDSPIPEFDPHLGQVMKHFFIKNLDYLCFVCGIMWNLIFCSRSENRGLSDI